MNAWRRVACGVASVVTLTSCGGENDAASVEWANDVCSAVITWREAVAASPEAVRSTGSVETGVAQVEDATDELTAELRSLGAPETEAGDAARDVLAALGAQIRADVEAVERAVAGAEGTAGARDAAITIAAALQALRGQVSTTVEELRDLDAQGELDDAFDDAESCDELRDER